MAKIHSSQVGVADVEEMAMMVIRAMASSFMLVAEEEKWRWSR